MIDTTFLDDALYRYNGAGNLNIDGNRIQCEFLTGQLRNGTLHLICSTDSHYLFPTSANSVLIYKGFTLEGLEISIEGQVIARKTNNTVSTGGDSTSIHYIFTGSSSIKIGAYSENNISEIRFLITNFEFIGTDIDEVRRSLSVLTINLNDTILQIHQLPDYEQKIDKLKLLKNTDVTSYISLKLPNMRTFATIMAIVDNLCKLLTVAKGTLISHIAFELISQEGDVIYREHYPRITLRHIPLPLIDKMPPERLKIFVESTYYTYKQLREKYQFDKVVHIYATTRSNDFIETRGLALASLVEHLVNVFIEDKDQETLVPANVFDAVKGKIKTSLQEILLKLLPQEHEASVPKFVNKIDNFRYQRFQDQLQGLIEYYRVPVTEEDIAHFVQTRNNLVHELDYLIPGSADEYFRMLHFVDKLLLRMLNYTGCYINASRTESQWSGECKDELKPA